MKEILQRLRFAWNVIRHGVPDGRFSPMINSSEQLLIQYDKSKNFRVVRHVVYPDDLGYYYNNFGRDNTILLVEVDDSILTNVTIIYLNE